MRLLVAHDGRDGGRDALELARLLAASDPSSSVLVVTVLQPDPLEARYGWLDAEDAGDAAPALEEARERLAGIAIQTRAYGSHSPGEALTAIAEEERFDVILVGSPHRGPIGRVMLGNVGASLLNGAPTDVAVAPRGYANEEHESLRNIAVGYDGGAEAKVALQRAEALAKPAGATLRLLTVVTPPVATPVMVAGAYSPEYPPDPERVIDEGLRSVENALAAEPVRLDGDPATELTRECAEGVDLLVVGSRGYGPLARVLLGSVSRKVVQDAPCPVLVVRRA
jgi:nucleotide-binding universal stress UspA family protein